MKKLVCCTPKRIREPPQKRGNEQFLFLELRKVQDNVVNVTVQPTADYKRYDDSHKCMTNVLGSNVRKIYFVLCKT